MCKVVHDRLGNKVGCTHLCHTPSPKPCRICTHDPNIIGDCAHDCHQAKPEGKCKDCQFEDGHSFECPQYVEKDPPEFSPEKKEGLNRISGEAAFELGFKQGQESIMKSGASVGKPKKVKECTCYGLVGTKKHAKECELSAELCECGKKIPEAYVQQSMIKFCSVECCVKHFPPAKKCKKCGVVDSSGLTPRTNSAMCNPHEWVDFSPAKEEKERVKKGNCIGRCGEGQCCQECLPSSEQYEEVHEIAPKEEKECGKDKCQMAGNCPTLTEQKGEELEKFYFVEYQDVDEFTKDLGTYIAAKKKEWEAQKEQAVKAEIRDEVKMRRKLVWNWQKETKELDAFNQAIDEILSLLSDKVNH